MVYVLVGIHSESGKHKLENIRELTDDEMDKITKAINSLNSYNSGFSLYEICEENYSAIESFLNELSEIKGGNQETLHKVIIKWNTLTLNYLSSFRMFIDHNETHLKSQSGEENNNYSHFKLVTGFHYDNYFSYRFSWNLRNYFQHVGIPPTHWIFTQNNETGDTEKKIVKIYYDRDGMLRVFDWGKILNDIKSQPNEIDIVFHLQRLQKSILEISMSLNNINIKNIRNSFDLLSTIQDEVKTSIPDAVPAIAKWNVENDSAPEFLGFSELPLRIMTRIRETIHI